MAKVDGYHNIAPVLHVPPGTYTATETPAVGVDLQGYESCTFIIATGGITSGTWTVTFQESDTANFAVPIPIANDDEAKLIGATPGPFTDTGFDEKIYKVGYIGLKRFVRCIITETVAGSAEFCVVVERGTPHSAPTPDDLNA